MNYAEIIMKSSTNNKTDTKKMIFSQIIDQIGHSGRADPFSEMFKT